LTQPLTSDDLSAPEMSDKLVGWGVMVVVGIEQTQ